MALAQVEGLETDPDPSFSIWGGYSFHSMRFLGKTTNSETQIFAIGYQRKVYDFQNNIVLRYTADLIPYIHYDYPKRDEGYRMVSRSGFGFSPVGLLFREESERILTPYLQSTAAFINMEENFPTDLARKLNFTFDVSLGGNVKVSPHFLASFGYKFHHISNAETGAENPGLDSNFLFISISFNK